MSQSTTVDDVHAREAIVPTAAVVDVAQETEARRRGLEHAVQVATPGTQHQTIIVAALAYAEFLLGRFVSAVEPATPVTPATPVALSPPAQ